MLELSSFPKSFGFHVLRTVTRFLGGHLGHRSDFLWASQVALMVKNPPANARELTDLGLILGLGRSPGGRHGNPLQYSCLENSMDRGAWQATVHEIAKSGTQLKQLSI